MPTKTVDWKGVRETFERTSLSASAIGRTYGVSHTAINKRADSEGWAINAERAELKAKAVGGSSLGMVLSCPDSGQLKREHSPTAWRRARELYEGTHMPMHQIAKQVGIPEVDIDFRIAEPPGWSRFGTSRPAERVENESIMTPPVGAPAAPAVPFEERPDLRGVRSPIRDLERRDKPPIVTHKSRKVKSSAIVEMSRDAAEALITQLRDAIGNRDTLMDMLEEWNEDNRDDPRRAEKYAAMFKALSLKELSLGLKNAISAAKAAHDQSGEGVKGKKASRDDRAAELTEAGGNFASMPPPRLAANNGARVEPPK